MLPFHFLSRDSGHVPVIIFGSSDECIPLIGIIETLSITYSCYYCATNIIHMHIFILSYFPF